MSNLTSLKRQSQSFVKNICIQAVLNLKFHKQTCNATVVVVFPPCTALHWVNVWDVGYRTEQVQKDPFHLPPELEGWDRMGIKNIKYQSGGSMPTGILSLVLSLLNVSPPEARIELLTS